MALTSAEKLGPIGGSGPVDLGSFWENNKGPAALAGGSLVAGLAGRFAENRYDKNVIKPWLDRQSKFAVTGDQVNGDIEEAIYRVSGRRVGNMAPAIRHTGGQSLVAAGAKTGLRGVGAARMGAKGLQEIESMVKQVQGMGSDLQRRREGAIGAQIGRKTQRGVQTGLMSAAFMRSQSMTGYAASKAAGARWQRGIAGLSKLGAAILTGGQSEIAKMLAAELASEGINNG